MKTVLRILLFASLFSLTASAQAPRMRPIVYELTCPSGFSPIPNLGQTFDLATGLWRANFCVSASTGRMVCQMSGCNKSIYADQQVGATIDAQVNACIAAVIAGGGEICDATGLTSSGTVAAQINVGNSSAAAVTLILPPSASWSVSITDGTSCGIKQFNKSRIIGTGLGNNGSTFRLIPASISTSVRALYCTDPASTGSYMQAENFIVDNHTVVGTMAVAALEIGHLFDSSSFSNITVLTGAGIGAEIYDICCGTSFTHFNVDGFSSTGVTPLVIGNSTLGGAVDGGGVIRTAFNDNSITHPGTGMPTISIAGINTNDGFTFNDLYMEPNVTDNSTALVQIGAQAHGVGFNGFAVINSVGGSTAYAVDVATWGGPTDDYFIGCKSQTLKCVNDHVTGTQLLGNSSYGQAGGYFSGPLMAGSYLTAPNCKVNSASPAACTSAAAGSVVVPTTTTSYTVNTSAITANSEIQLQYTTDNTGLPSAPTCVTPLVTAWLIPSARVAGTSFTFTLPSTTGTVCVHYEILN